MQPQCIDAVNQAVGRVLSASELKGIEDRISRHMRQNAARDPAGTLAMTKDQRYLEAAASAHDEFMAEQAKKAQRTALQVVANARIAQVMDAYKGDKLDGLSRVIAAHADTKGNFQSVETQAKAIERDALRQMIGTLEASNPKWFGLLENNEGVRAIVREIFGEASGVKEAKDGAAQFKAVADALRDRFNRAGGDVGKLEDWGMPHHHSQVKVAKAGREQWVSDILPYVKRERYMNEDGTRMNDAQMSEFLGHAWESIATGGVNKLQPGQFAGNGMRANRGNESRQIHFKDADSYMAYQAGYGERTLYEVLTHHIMGVSKDIALVETFGPNPDHAFRTLRDGAVKDGTMADPTRAGKLKEKAVNVENLFNYVSGKTAPVASEWLARSFDTLRNWLVASRLGSAVISSLSDEATLHLTARVNNLPEMRLLANELAAFNPLNRAEEKQALRAGLAMNTFIASLNRFGAEGLGSSFSSKLAGSTMRASGLNAMTDARRRAFGVTYMGALGKLAQDFDSLAKLDATDHRILLSKGITEENFAVWRKATREDWGNGNDTMLTPESIYRIPDADLAAMGDPRKLREQAATKLLGTVLEETDIAVIEPGARERSAMMDHVPRGTWKGELTRSFFLFKSFPIAMITRHVMRGMDMPTGTGKAAYLATLLAGTTIAGAAALQINEVISGRDPRNLDPTEGAGRRGWIAAMLKGGSLGMYGDFLFSEATQHGQSPVAAFMGPVIGLGESFFNLTQGNLVQAAQGKVTHAGAETVKFLKGNLPGASLWYAKAALDHMVFHKLQEYFSPGYLSNMRSRAQKEFGQSFWWQPGEMMPNRAPNVASIAGAK